MDAVDHDRHPRDRLVRELGLLDATMLVVSSVIGVGHLPHAGGDRADSCRIPGLDPRGLARRRPALARRRARQRRARRACTRTPAATTSTCARRTIRWPGSWSGWLLVLRDLRRHGRDPRGGVRRGVARAFRPARRRAASLALAIAAIDRHARRSTTRACGAGAQVNNASSLVKLVGARRVRGRGGSSSATAAPTASSRCSPAPERRRRSSASASRSRRCSSPTSAGTRRSTWRARSATPARTLPRSLFLGLGALHRSLYLALNVVYLYALPHRRAARRAATRARPRRARSSARSAATLDGALVLASILGYAERDHPGRAAHRLRDGARRPLLPRRAARCTPCIGTPHVAIVRAGRRRDRRSCSCCGASRACSTTRRSRSCSRPWPTRRALSRCAVADPHLPRPYRAWGYPFVPALYLVANAGIALAMLRGRPLECLAALGVTLGALPFWILFGRRQRTGCRSGAVRATPRSTSSARGTAARIGRCST